MKKEWPKKKLVLVILYDTLNLCPYIIFGIIDEPAKTMINTSLIPTSTFTKQKTEDDLKKKTNDDSFFLVFYLNHLPVYFFLNNKYTTFFRSLSFRWILSLLFFFSSNSIWDLQWRCKKKPGTTIQRKKTSR